MRSLLPAVAVLLALGLCAPAAHAEPLGLTYGDGFFLGRVNDGVPSGDDDSAAYINYLITLGAGAGFSPYGGEIFDRLASTVTGPFPTADYVSRDDTGYNAIDASGYSYVLAKYGKNPTLVWFVNGAAGEVTVPSTYKYPTTNSGGGLSHVALFNYHPVPDGGTTLALLAGALVGLGTLRGKLRR